MSERNENPVAYVDFDRCIVCVDPNAPLVPDDRSERQKQWDDMVMSCKVIEIDDGFGVDLRVHHHFFDDEIYHVVDRPPVTTHPRTVDSEGMILVNLTQFNAFFASREYAEGIAQRAFTLFRAAREHWHACEQKIKALKTQRRIYGATHDQFNHHGGMVRQ